MKRCVCVIFCLLFCLVGCAEQKQGRRFSTTEYFNTEFAMTVHYSAEEAVLAEECWAAVKAELAATESELSLTGENSSVAAFNRAPAGSRVFISERAYEVLSIAKKMYEFTEGCYNPAMGLLVDLWGFTPRFLTETYAPETAYDRADFEAELPSEEYVSAFLGLSDFSLVTLGQTDEGYFAQKPDCSLTMDGVTYTMQLDLSGIGKGYAVDRARESFLSYGFTEGYLNFGSSSLQLFARANGRTEWDLGVINPHGDGHCLTVQTANTAVSSSGNYERYYTIEGVRYCHILDPFTGKPIAEDLELATVFTTSAAEGDALSTALAVMGTERAVAFLRTYDLQGALVKGDTVYTRLDAVSSAGSGFSVRRIV